MYTEIMSFHTPGGPLLQTELYQPRRIHKESEAEVIFDW